MLIEYVNIGGAKRPVKFGFNALAMFCDMTGMTIADLQNIGATIVPRQMIQLIWCGLNDGARAAGVPFEGTVKVAAGDEKIVPVSVEMVGDWMDEDPQVITEMMTLYGNSQARASKKKKG